MSPLRSLARVTEREDRYRELYDLGYQPLQAFARRRASGPDVEDLVADVFTVAWRRLDDIPSDNALAWLYGVAHRTLANQRRARDRRGRLVQRMAEQAPGEVAPPTGATRVLDALSRLRPEDQEILRLAAWEELTTSEIAVTLGCTPNAAALRLSRARARLRDAMTGSASSRTHHERTVTDG